MKYYDTIAKGYNELYREEQLAKLELIREYLDRTNQLPDESKFILDVGCGTGVTSKVLKGRIIGIDPSIELLKQAQNTERMRGNCIQAVAEYLPFKDNLFELTVSITAVQNFDDLELGLREIKRVSRDLMIITVPLKSPKLEQIRQFIEDKFTVQEILEEEKDLIYLIKLFKNYIQKVYINLK